MQAMFESIAPRILNHIEQNVGGNQNLRRHLQLVKKPVYKCNRQFCNVCLMTCYDEDFNLAKNSRSWICQFCMGFCFCTRCLRQDTVTQLKAFYFQLGGHFPSLINQTRPQSAMDRVIESNLKAHLLLTLLCNQELCRRYEYFMELACL